MAFLECFILGKRNLMPALKYLNFLKCQKMMLRSCSKNFSEYQTMFEVRNKLEKIIQSDENYQRKPKPKDHLLKYLPKSQSDLPSRKMKDSFDNAIVPLSSDLTLKDKYVSFLGNVRVGRLLEDLDMFAVLCSMKHLISDEGADRPFPYTIVTVRVDYIEISQRLTNQTLSDIRLSGHVCWTGTSSLEVIVYLDQQENGNWVRMVKALFLMAARNPLNNGPAIVNPVVADTPEEEALLLGGNERKLKRIQMMKKSLLKEVPTVDEFKLIHDLFIKTTDSKAVFHDTKVLPPNSIWMQDAVLNNLVFCHPEHRNLHNKIFGGFLMRQAVELSWSLAYIHGAQLPTLVHISDIAFYSPVDVGSLLKLYGSVNYAEGKYIQVFVHAEAYSMSNKKGKSTTSFYFTYKLNKNATELYPSTYMEAMKYIDGRRHFQQFLLQNSSEKNSSV